MPIFKKEEESLWSSTPRAMGPFRGLHGGALAGLLSAELEMIAADQGLGIATSASVQFLRPTTGGALQTIPETVRRGRRASILTNRIVQNGQPTAVATIVFIQPMSIPVEARSEAPDAEPAELSVLPARAAPHGGPWMMDNFDVRISEAGIFWFRYKDGIVDGMTPMARVLGPADWTHGLRRPRRPQLADPNVSMQISLSRHPEGEYIGILPATRWTGQGIGFGEGKLYDQSGDIGRVIMSVALTPV